MSNAQRMKIMKKLIYSVLALAGILAVSCNKEVEAPVAPELTGGTHKVTLKAAFSQEDTRTSYANNKTFSWKEGDVVYVRCLNEETEYWYWAAFVAESAGATTDLTGEVEDGFEPYDVAVYAPGPDYVGTLEYNDSDVAFVAPISYHEDGYGLTVTDGEKSPYWNSVSIPSAEPLSLLPLVSVTKEDVLYFQTAMGVLKVNLTDVPAEATHVRITAAGDACLGNYLMVQDGEIRMNEPWFDEDGQRYATSYAEYYFEPVSDGKVSFMMPIPVGTLAEGSMLYVMDENGGVLFSKQFKKDVVVARNKITELAPLSAKVEWVALGTGKFGDHIHYNPGYDQDVVIEQNAGEPTQFRIADPYAGYRTEIEYEPTGTEYGPDEYFYFEILKKGTSVEGVTVTHDDLVWFGTYYTGIIDDSYGVDPIMIHPSFWAEDFPESTWLRSIVVKYQDDGVTPANIQLAPILFWIIDPDKGSGYWSNDNYLYSNNLIEIKFPGAERIDLSASVDYLEIADPDTDQAVALVEASFSDAFASADLVIASSASAAAAAFAAGTHVTTVTEASDAIEVKLPAKAPTGDYYVYMKTTPKEGLTPVAMEAGAQTVVSSKFHYTNANTDLGLTVDVILGTWSGPIIYNDGKEYTQETFDLTFGETDDPFSGDVMLTNVWGDDADFPVYGWFDGKLGILTIPAAQPLMEYNTAYDIVLADANSPAKALEFRYQEDGSLYLQSCEFVGFYAYRKGTTTPLGLVGYFYGDTDDYYCLFTKESGANSAPAALAKSKAPHRMWNIHSEVQASRVERQSAIQPKVR